MKQELSSDNEVIDELNFSQDRGFFEQNLGIRVLIGLFFFISLFIVIHFREIRVEVLELSSVAPSYIVAQVDFDFPDEEATIIRREEMIRGLGRIYQIQESDLAARRAELETEINENDSWRDENQKNNLATMYRTIDNLEKHLRELRFTDSRTIQRMKDLNLPTNDYVVFFPGSSEAPVAIPRDVWNTLSDEVFSPDFPKTSADYLIKQLSSKTWTVNEDLSAERTIKRKIQSKVPEVHTHVTAGSRVIDQGEKVTARHIAMLQAMKTALNENRNLWHPLTLLGSFILTAIITGICILYFRQNFPQALHSNRKLFLLVTLCVLTMAFGKIIELFILSSNTKIIEIVRFPLFVPFAALLLCSLTTTQIATFVSGFLVVVLTLFLSFEHLGFMLLNLGAALTIILSTRVLHRRKEIFIACGKAWLTCFLIIIALHFQQGAWWSLGTVTDTLGAAIFMLITGVAVIGVLPLLEAGFGMVTDVTLMEYMDPNNDLLRRLSIEASGTYQHSIVVGNLAEAAAIAIDANGLFCRVATLYHDVGKMVTPQYFTENQSPGMNIHQLLTPLESAQVIMAHVTEGVAMARKAGLPEQFIDIIKEHHGTTLVYYFYRKELERVSGDPSAVVDEALFRYSGPKPRSKESAIIMIADSLEAASRSLETINETTVMELANRLVKEKADDGQFDNCLLTFEEMAIVKETLAKTLVAFNHSRVKYPNRPERKSEHGHGSRSSSIA